MSIIVELAARLSKSEWEVSHFLANAPKKYRVYSIPKRKHGHRVIAQPTPDLKCYQRSFIELFRANFPVHDAAMAYKKGIGIRDNALTHSTHRYLLKMDFENFFNSINKELFWKVWLSIHGRMPNQSDMQTIERLLFWQPNKKNKHKLILSIGAPSSPLLSNFCMYQFDGILADFCSDKSISYTRYADDITFSTNKKDALFCIPDKVQSALRECFGRRLTVNHSKTAFSSMAHNRHVTGVTITNESKLSIGRNRKRYIKHLVHRFLLGTLEVQDIYYLQGILAFANYIEPRFIGSLQLKHPELDLNKIFEVINE